jgi:protein involved in polysaccharide export with SLBB domain
MLKPTGRIVLNLDPEDQGLEKLMALSLEDGDRYFVPVKVATVNVFGAVYNQNAFLHDPKLRVEDYLSEAGGLTRNADKKHLLIIRADGSVIPKRSSGPFTKAFEAARLNPGDSIAVPTEMFKVPFMRGLRDWTQVFSQLALGAAAINVLK